MQINCTIEEVKAEFVNVFLDDMPTFLRNNPLNPSCPGDLSKGIF
jgi:hypothetical protein